MNKVETKNEIETLKNKVKSLTGELLTCYEELDFIYESGDILSAVIRGEVREWKGIAGEILDSAMEVFEADIGWISFVEDGGTSDIDEVREIDAERAEDILLAIGGDLKKGTLYVNNSLRDNLKEWRKNDPASLIVAPFKSRGRLLGHISLGRSTDDSFNSHLIKLITHLSSYIARVIENARMFQEITQAYQLQKEANENLQKLNNMKENFIAITSHELKTPLTILSMCVDMMHDEEIWPLNEMQKEVTVTIGESISGLERIVRKINETARITEERLSLKREIVDVLDIIDTVLKCMDLIIKQRNINVYVNVRSGMEISVDVGLIREVLAEIILNAVRHTPDGGKIEIRCQKQDGETVLSVADSGQGIPDEKKDGIFDMFSAVGSHMHHSSGTHEYGSGGLGVGLAIAKGIIEAHEGRIWVEDSLGDADSGAKTTLNTFCFSIPHGFDDA